MTYYTRSPHGGAEISPLLTSGGVEVLEEQENPRAGVEEKVEPVNGPYQPALKKHGEFFEEMGREKRGKTEGKAEEDHRTPRKLCQELLHKASIPHDNSSLRRGCEEEGKDKTMLPLDDEELMEMVRDLSPEDTP